MGAVADVGRAGFGDHGRAGAQDVDRPLGNRSGHGQRELAERPVVDRQHVVGLGLQPPGFDHLGQELGHLGGPVVTFAGIGPYVVELPAVVTRRRVLGLDLLVGDRLVPVAVEGPASEHLVVLGGAHLGVVTVTEHAEQRRPLDRRLRHTVDRDRRLHPARVQDRRGEVDGVAVLGPDRAGVGDTGGPVDDQRVGHAALVDLPLPAPERGVAGHRPAPRVVVVDGGSTDLVDAFERLPHRGAEDVPVPQVVERSAHTALRRRPVVGQHHEDRVVEVTGGVQVGATSRPIWSSVWVSMAANASMKRAWTRRSSSLNSSQAGTQSGRGDSSVCSGTTPDAR